MDVKLMSTTTTATTASGGLLVQSHRVGENTFEEIVVTTRQSSQNVREIILIRERVREFERERV